MERLRLLKNGLPLWDIRVHSDGSILGEMIGADRKVRALTGRATVCEIEALRNPPSVFAPLRDDYRSNSADIIVSIRHDDSTEETFLLADAPPDSAFRTQCQHLLERLIERGSER